MLSYSECDAVGCQSFRLSSQDSLPGISCLKHDKTFSVECLALIVLETLHRHRIAVIDSGYEGRAFNIESNEVVCIRAKIAFGINYGGKEADEAVAVTVALQAFEDGLVRIFHKDEELLTLSQAIDVQENDLFTFLRLTMLAGRLF